MDHLLNKCLNSSRYSENNNRARPIPNFFFRYGKQKKYSFLN